MRHRLRIAGLIAASLGVAAVVTVAAALVVGPRLPGATAAGTVGAGPDSSLAALVGAEAPVPVAGPVTPTGHPYDEFALLRRQRMSTDVLPAALLPSDGSGPSVVASSARLLARDGKKRQWLVASPSGGVCVLGGATDDDGYILNCTGADTVFRSGGIAIDGGRGRSFAVTVVADGTPSADAVRGMHRIGSNTWLPDGARGEAAPAPPTIAGDPEASPAVEPYSDYAILRRDATSADALPAGWADRGSLDGGLTDGALTDGDSIGPDDVIATSARYAGRDHGYRIWAAAADDGQVCLILLGPTPSADDLDCSGGGSDGGITAATASTTSASGSGPVYGLYPDGRDRASTIVNPSPRRIAPNVWAALPR